MTGRVLKGWMEESKDYDPKETPHPAYGAGRLNGYLIGLADTLAFTRGFCPPRGFSERELKVLVEKHLEHDYAGRDQLATPQIVKILQRTYPCQPLPQRKKPGASRDQDI